MRWQAEPEIDEMDDDPYLEHIYAHLRACDRPERACPHLAHRREHLRLRKKAQKKWQKIRKHDALDDDRLSRAKRIVRRYVRSRDADRCGGCGNRHPKDKTILATIVPSGIGHFGLSDRGIVTISRHEWTTRGQSVDNVQAACQKSCRSSGKNAKEWRNSVMERVPVAHSPDNNDCLWLPF